MPGCGSRWLVSTWSPSRRALLSRPSIRTSSTRRPWVSLLRSRDPASSWPTRTRSLNACCARMQSYGVGSSRSLHDVTDGGASQRGAATDLDELLVTLAEAPDLA